MDLLQVDSLVHFHQLYLSFLTQEGKGVTGREEGIGGDRRKVEERGRERTSWYSWSMGDCLLVG